MKSYCVKCRNDTENLNLKIFKTKSGRLVLQSKYADCAIKSSRFVKKQEEKRLITSLGLKRRLSKIALFGDIFFWVYKMNEIVNKFLLVGDKFMPQMHLKQPGFTYSACGPFSRKKKNWKVYADRKHRFYLQKWAW